MRATTILLFACLGLAACKNPDKLMKDLAYGAPVKADFDAINERAQYVLSKKYPLGLDPDRSDEPAGEYFTVWRYDTSVLYRKTIRHRAHVRIQDMGNGQVRIGIAVVEQINDNIDNPDSIEEGKWQSTQRSGEKEAAIEQDIAKRWAKFEVSTSYKEKHADKPRTGLRPDLVEKYRDVDLQEYEEGGESGTAGQTPAISGDAGFEEESREEAERRKRFEELE